VARRTGLGLRPGGQLRQLKYPVLVVFFLHLAASTDHAPASCALRLRIEGADALPVQLITRRVFPYLARGIAIGYG
jgi:hypothetical protein